MLLNVILAGIIAFNFFEPLANLLDDAMKGGAIAGYEDAAMLTILFVISLGLLRFITSKIADTTLDFSGMTNQIGGAVFGLITGYLVAGFLFCVFETLPWHESFLDFEPRTRTEGGLRDSLARPRLAGDDAARRGVSAGLAFGSSGRGVADDRHRTFDRQGTFELAYLRYRRYGDYRPPLTYGGELNKSLDLDAAGTRK